MKKITTFCLLIYFFIGMSHSNAQTFEVGIDYGTSSYFGDLTPYSVKTGFTIGGEAIGLSYGVSLNKHFSVKFGYVWTKINGSDRNAVDSVIRRKRNLSFVSEIREYGGTFEVNLFSFTDWKFQDKVNPYIIVGLNYFNFDPKAELDGEYVRLQPLGTEGQGLASYPDIEKYSLGQFNIPFGAGIKFKINKNLFFGFGVKYRMTFTDYLDDVSGEYADLEELARSNGALSAELAYRTDELAGQGQSSEVTGTLRGNPNSNDWYMTTFISIGYKWTKVKKRKKGRHIGKCPKRF